MISSQTENHPAKTFLTINLFFLQKVHHKTCIPKAFKSYTRERQKYFKHIVCIQKQNMKNKTKHLSLRQCRKCQRSSLFHQEQLFLCQQINFLYQHVYYNIYRNLLMFSKKCHFSQHFLTSSKNSSKLLQKQLEEMHSAHPGNFVGSFKRILLASFQKTLKTLFLCRQDSCLLVT